MQKEPLKEHKNEITSEKVLLLYFNLSKEMLFSDLPTDFIFSAVDRAFHHVL